MPSNRISMKLMHRLVQRATDEELQEANLVIMAEVLRRKGIQLPGILRPYLAGTVSEEIEAATEHLFETLDRWQTPQGEQANGKPQPQA